MEPGISDNRFALVVPTLNEAGNIGRILPELTEALSATQLEYEIIVVDDGSTDGTVEQVREWSKRDPRIRFFRAPENEAWQGRCCMAGVNRKRTCLA